LKLSGDVREHMDREFVDKSASSLCIIL
jgi:hypothetical protein